MGNRKWGEDAAPLDKDAAEDVGVLRRSGDFLVSTCRARSPYGPVVEPSSVLSLRRSTLPNELEGGGSGKVEGRLQR